MTFEERLKRYKEARRVEIPEKPPVYLEQYGDESNYDKNSPARRYCGSCERFAALSHFHSIHKGVYLSVLCKSCLSTMQCDTYEYDISRSKVYKTLLNRLRYKTGILSLDYKDVPEELMEAQKQMIILKTKINGKKNKGG